MKLESAAFIAGNSGGLKKLQTKKQELGKQIRNYEQESSKEHGGEKTPSPLKTKETPKNMKNNH